MYLKCLFDSLLSHCCSTVVVFALINLLTLPPLLAQVEAGPVIEIDKKIVFFDETGQQIETDNLGEVLVGTPIFFKYRVAYTGYITSTVVVTPTGSITGTIPVEMNCLAITDDNGTLNKGDDFACIRATEPFTATFPVAATGPFTTTLEIGDTVVFTDTIPFLPGNVFECVSNSGIYTDTRTVFTPRTGVGYINLASAVPGSCTGDGESGASDSASYVGLYWAFTPGFWKNHTGGRRSGWRDAWAYTAFDPGTPLVSVFQELEGFDGLDEDNLLDAVSYKGGKGDEGAARILLRAAVAALLNASFHEEQNSPDVGSDGELLLPDGRVLFPHSSEVIMGLVNGLLFAPNRSAMLMVAEELDAVNDGIHYINWDAAP